MSPAIHKDAFIGPTLAHGPHTIPGIPRTIGVDPNGCLAVWYETDAKEHEYVLLFTGDELADNEVVIGSTVWGGLVWHLAIKGEWR